jgi:hypothetical protein
MFGVKVRIIPPDSLFPDKIKIAESLPPKDEEALLDEDKPETAEVPTTVTSTEETAEQSQETPPEKGVQAEAEATEETGDEEGEAKE